MDVDATGEAIAMVTNHEDYPVTISIGTVIANLLISRVPVSATTEEMSKSQSVEKNNTTVLQFPPESARRLDTRSLRWYSSLESDNKPGNITDAIDRDRKLLKNCRKTDGRGMRTQ